MNQFKRILLLFLLTCFHFTMITYGAQPEKNTSVKYYEFTLRGHSQLENFIVKTSNSSMIAKVAEQLELPENERTLHINGPIDYTNGGFNLDWSWHFITNEWDIVEMSIELCDGTTSYIEAHLEEWIAEVGVFCPWSSYVLREIEYICGDANGDTQVNVSDAVYIINYVFVGGDAPDPIEAGDANCDATVNVSDAVYLINYVFVGGTAPCDPNGDEIPDC